MRSASESSAALIANPRLPAVVGDRATKYVSEQMWDRVIHDRSGRRCVTLAYLARSILDGRERLHEGLGEVASRMLGLLNRSSVERQFASELVKQLPLPTVDENLIAAARGLQVTGIVVCVARSSPLTRCACFTDVVIVEGQAKVKSLITAGMEDWLGLGDFGGRGLA